MLPLKPIGMTGTKNPTVGSRGNRASGLLPLNFLVSGDSRSGFR